MGIMEDELDNQAWARTRHKAFCYHHPALEVILILKGLTSMWLSAWAKDSDPEI